MSKGICSKCKKKLNKINSTPSIFKQGRGRCRICEKKYKENNKERFKRSKHEYYVNNTEKIKDRSSKRYYEKREQILVRLAKYYEDNKEKILAKQKTFKGRHKTLCYFLRKENVSKKDLLWHFNFYVEIIREDKCHYCDGQLNKSGMGLDAVDNKIGHVCYNVVPCCRSCNQKKMHDVSYSDFMEIKPWLIKIRLGGVV
jgi:hypothetical protein